MFALAGVFLALVLGRECEKSSLHGGDGETRSGEVNTEQLIRYMIRQSLFPGVLVSKGTEGCYDGQQSTPYPLPSLRTPCRVFLCPPSPPLLVTVSASNLRSLFFST